MRNDVHAHFPPSFILFYSLLLLRLLSLYSISQERRHERLDWNRGRSIHVRWRIAAGMCICVCIRVCVGRLVDRHERRQGWGRRLIRLSRMYAVPSSYANKLGRNSRRKGERKGEKERRREGMERKGEIKWDVYIYPTVDNADNWADLIISAIAVNIHEGQPLLRGQDSPRVIGKQSSSCHFRDKPLITLHTT